MKNLLALGAAVAAAASGQAFAAQAGTPGDPIILINEIRTDQPAGDDDEYFEIFTIPSSVSLDGLTYIVIGDGAGGSGTIESVTDLTGSATGTDGLFLAGESTMTIGVPDLVTNLNFENSDNTTHLIVEGFTGANGDDLDTLDDGVLDVTPWTRVVDAISLVETTDLSGTTDDFFYAGSLGFTELGPDGTFVPGHAFRCLTSLTDWRIGSFASAGESDTAGEFNSICTGETSIFCDPGVANSVSATGGKIGFTGSFSEQRNLTTLTCEDIPDNFGLFLQSDVVMAPAAAQVGGNLCLGGTLVRLNQILIASGNQVSLQLDISDDMLNEFGTVAGSTLHYQYYYRDASTAGGGNFSNGITATWTL